MVKGTRLNNLRGVEGCKTGSREVTHGRLLAIRGHNLLLLINGMCKVILEHNLLLRIRGMHRAVGKVDAQRGMRNLLLSLKNLGGNQHSNNGVDKPMLLPSRRRLPLLMGEGWVQDLPGIHKALDRTDKMHRVDKLMRGVHHNKSNKHRRM